MGLVVMQNKVRIEGHLPLYLSTSHTSLSLSFFPLSYLCSPGIRLHTHMHTHLPDCRLTCILRCDIMAVSSQVKPESRPAISLLQQARIRPVMVTGDHGLTAVSVAREVKIVQPDKRVMLAELQGSYRTSTEAWGWGCVGAVRACPSQLHHDR